MKKKILIILAIILILTGCKQKETIDYEKIESEAKITLLEVTNVTEDKIKENFNVIVDNLNEKGKEEDILKASYYLKEVSSYTDDTDMNTLAIKVIEYYKDKISNYREILSLIDKVKEENYQTIYLDYHKNATFKKLFNDQNLQATADLNDDSRKNVTYIREAINYIEVHIDNPLENNTVAEKITYYSLFLSLDGKNIVNTLGKDTKNYLLSLDPKDKEEITKDLTKLNKNKSKYLNEYLKEIK